MTLVNALVIAAQGVRMPPIPEDRDVNPVVSMSEVGMFVVAAVLTVIVAVTLIVFVVRQQRIGPRNG